MIKLRNIGFAILLPVTVFSQNKTIVPTKGTIVFQSKNIIFDEKLYGKSFNNFKTYILKAIKSDTQDVGVEAEISHSNEIEEQMIEDTFNAFFSFKDQTKKFKYFQEMRGSFIYCYETLNGKPVGSRMLDISTGATDDILKDFEYYSKDEILSLQEFPEQIKIINGYECFKVIYFLKENTNAILDNLSNGFINYREIWVTTKIKCKYHPVINDRLILEKYYPLEINEYYNLLEGFYKKYELIKLDFQ